MKKMHHNKKPAHKRRNSPWFGRPWERCCFLLRNQAKGLKLRMTIAALGQEYVDLGVWANALRFECRSSDGRIRFVCELAVMDDGSLLDALFEQHGPNGEVLTAGRSNGRSASKALGRFTTWIRAIESHANASSV
jgi:hypothetical protein